MERNEDKQIIILKEKLNSPWLFYGLENQKKGVEVDKDLILDEELDFISIIVDFYTVEVFHKNVGGCLKGGNDNGINRKASDYYGKLLRLKLFYQNELSNILENIEDLDEKLKKMFESFSEINFFSWRYMNRLLLYTMDLRQINLIVNKLHIELYKETKKRESYFIEQLTENQKLMLRLYSLNYIYADLFEDLELQGSILFSCDSWEDLIKTSEKILDHLDEYQKRSEFVFFLLNTVELDRIGRMLDIDEMAEQYSKAIDELKLNKFEENKINCYASVRKNNIIYMTLNGVKDDSIKVNGVDRSNLQKVVDILAQLLGGDVEYVSISPDTRYYINPDLYINYSQYKNSNENLNRMFTCCERKLIAKMFTLKFGDDEKIELLVTKYPCEICLRTLRYVNNKEGAKFKIEIIDPLEKEDKLSEQDIIEMDKCAEKIDKNHPREQEE